MTSRAEALVIARAAVPYFQEQHEAKPNWYTRARLDSALRTIELLGEKMNITDQAVEAAAKAYRAEVTTGTHAQALSAALEAAAPHLMAEAASELRELPFEELQSQVVLRDWPEALNVHRVINDVADWVERRSAGAGE